MADDDEVQFAGRTGTDVMRDAPHARYQCLTCPLPANDADSCNEAAMKACAKCFCWVCDQPYTACPHWSEHCLADGSPEWAVKRQKFIRTRGAQAGNDSAEIVRARFAAAAGDGAAAGSVPSSSSDGAAAGSAPTGLSAADEQRQTDREEQAEEEDTEEVFAEYVPRHLQGGQGHPDPVVETTSLSFAELPPITTTLKVPDSLFLPKTTANPFGGALSKVQLETVTYACQRHEVKLPSGARAGFFLGDGVGLGKGRQLAGVIFDNWMRGRKRHIWISVSADLCYDAERDLKDIGADTPIYNITKLPYDKLEKAKGPGIPRGGLKQGVLFSTYAALMGSTGKGASRKTRLDQMITWLGGDSAEGCILFDESHKAKHLFPESDAADGGEEHAADGDVPDLCGPAAKRAGGKGKSTKMALAVKDIQERCPGARIIYCSATGASSLSNMAYMERLGLWGINTPFKNFADFSKTIGNGGVGAMELIALDMKRRGMYISRQLCFKSASYDTKVVDLTARQQEMYDAAANFWGELFGCFATAMQILNVKHHPRKSKGNPHPSGRVMNHYWSCHQRFFRQMCMAIKVPEVVKLVKQALADNKCVVIGLQTTGESRLNDAVKRGEDLDEFAGMHEVLRFLIDKLPTGDFLNQYPESDLSEDSDSDAEDDLMHQAVSNGARKQAAQRKKRRDTDDEERSQDGEMDDSDAAFLDDDDSEAEDDDSDSMELDGDEKHRVKLPDQTKSLSMPQIRELLKIAKSTVAVACNTRGQLISLLKEVERTHLAGDGPSVESLMIKAKMIKLKRKQPDGEACSSDGPSGTRRRLNRSAANTARSKYVEDSDSDEDEEEAAGSGDDEAFSTSRDHALLHKSLEVKRDRTTGFQLGKVIAVNMKAARRKHQLEIGGETVWLDLKGVVWRYPSSKPAPGAAGASSAKPKPRKKVVSDSEDEEESGSGSRENKPVQGARAGRLARRGAGSRGKGRVKISDDDDDSDGSWSGSDEEKNDDGAWSGSEDSDKPKRGKGKGKAVAKPRKAPAKPRARKPALSDEEEEEEMNDDSDDEVGDKGDVRKWQHDRPDQIKQLQRLKRALLKKLKMLKMPDNPLDELINNLGGADAVSEMTGRKGRLVRNDGGKTVYEKRNKGLCNSDGGQVSQEKTNLAEKAHFMSGKKLVAIISEAASSGISLQADKRVENQRRRVHLTLELPWSADQVIQQCGRTHRSNQVWGPEYILIMTACGGERRFASTVAKRLQELGALTKADRRAADASDLSAFDVDTPYGRRAMLAIVEMLSNPGFHAQTPPSTAVRDALGLKANSELQDKWRDYLEAGEDALACSGIDDTISVKKFLNRLLGISVHLQNMIFSHFTTELDEQVRVAKASGKYDEGVVDIRGESIAICDGYPVTLATDGPSGVGLIHTQLRVDRGISYDRALELLNEKAELNDDGKLLKAEGFYRSTRPLIGREKEDIRGMAILTQKPIRAFALNPVPVYKVYRPGTGLGKDTGMKDFTLGGRYQKVEPEIARKIWTRNYDDAKLFCSHGPNCGTQGCMTGRREDTARI